MKIIIAFVFNYYYKKCTVKRKKGNANGVGTHISFSLFYIYKTEN